PAQAELAGELHAMTADRLRRAREMVGKLRELGMDITWEQVAAIAGDAVVGRPHLARAMVAAGAIAGPEQAFTADWIGAGGRAYVGRYGLDPGRAIRLGSSAGGGGGPAPPGAAPGGGGGGGEAVERVGRVARAGRGGLEVAHPDHDEAERRRLARLAGALGLAVSGGSDDHGLLTGHRLGCETIAPGEYERLMSLAAGA